MKGNNKLTKVWITKYALTSNILEVDAEIRLDGLLYSEFYYYTDEWHLTKEAAIAQAEKMRAKKINELKIELAKMEGLKFL